MLQTIDIFFLALAACVRRCWTGSLIDVSVTYVVFRWLDPYLFWKSSPVYTAYRERVTHSSSFGFGLPGISDEDPHPTAERSFCVRCQGGQCGNQMGAKFWADEPTTVVRASSTMHLHINVEIFMLDLPGVIVLLRMLVITGVRSNTSVFNLRRFQNLRRV